MLLLNMIVTIHKTYDFSLIGSLLEYPCLSYWSVLER